MGQKVNPHGLRVGIIKDWDSKWYADTKDGEFSDNLVEDYKIREFLKKELYSANISKIEIERIFEKHSRNKNLLQHTLRTANVALKLLSNCIHLA